MKNIVNKQNEEFRKKWKEIKQKTRVSKCLFSSFGECSEKIIKAHSIQNNKILRNISTNGEVMMFGLNAHCSLGEDLDKIGRKVATTFSGFCGNHDTKLFSNIENKDYVINNKEQEFLFAYRALCREVIAKEEQKNIFEYLLENYFLPNGKEWVNAIKIGLSEICVIKDFLDENLLNKNFDIFESIPIVLNGESKFSATSVFHLEFDFEKNLINDLANLNERVKPLFLTIFPQNGKTYILLSYLKRDSMAYRLFREQILNFSNKEITKKISLLIILYCENFTYSPEKWDSLNAENKKRFIDIFKETIEGDKLYHMDSKPPLDFFQ